MCNGCSTGAGGGGQGYNLSSSRSYSDENSFKKTQDAWNIWDHQKGGYDISREGLTTYKQENKSVDPFERKSMNFAQTNYAKNSGYNGIIAGASYQSSGGGNIYNTGSIYSRKQIPKELLSYA